MRNLQRFLVLIMIISIAILPSTLTVFAQEDPIVVEINEQNFPDPIFRSIISSEVYYDWSVLPAQQYYYDRNQDGFLSKSEIEAITYLTVAQRSIVDLTGIEYLTSLVELNCQYNLLTKLDVSKNTELLYLNCYHNMIVGPLDITNNTKLISVSCQNSPFLTDIISSELNHLELLACQNTGITSLDISKYPNLISVSIAATDIAELDTSNNPNLTGINAYNTNIASIDTSKNPKLDYIDLSQSNVSSIDVSNNTQLYVLALKFSPVAWVNLGENPNLDAQLTDSNISLEVPKNSFDITKVIPGIDPAKVSIISGAKLEGNIVSEYTFDTPIVYSYDCGEGVGGKVTLKVTANLTEVPEIPETPKIPATPGPSNTPPNTGDSGIIAWLAIGFISIIAALGIKSNAS